jgi:hypothetical protein
MKKLLLLLLIGSGCGAEGADPAQAADEEAIQGGAKDAKDPAVGMVWIRGGGFCSGTLVAPNVVLTAGHCVEQPVTGFDTGEGKGTHDVGPRPAGGFAQHRVVDQVAHPSYQSLDQCPNPTFDVALLRLAKPIAETAPLPLAADPPRAGATCRAVGYGVHDDRAGVTVEQRRSATEKVLGVDDTSVHVRRKSGIVDHGDSGGPLLCAGAIAGVTSCGNDGSGPGHREAYYGRVDSIAQWIQDTIAAWQ